jgi:hypothetical protein
MDIVVYYNREEQVIELKIWHGEQAEKDALDQLCGYLESRSLDSGFLLSFTDQQKRPREDRTFTWEFAGKTYTINEVVVAYKERKR